MEKTEGTVINLHPYRETSYLVHWCSKDHGLVRTLAKGGRDRKGPFGGKLDLFVKAEFDYLPARRSDLHLLREAAILDMRLGLRRTYARTLAAAYFVKLIELVAEPDTPIPGLHDLLERALNYLADQDPTRKAVLFFERETSKVLGLGSGDVHALGELHGRIPSQREELWERLG